jgi:hypothetical protein
MGHDGAQGTSPVTQVDMKAVGGQFHPEVPGRRADRGPTAVRWGRGGLPAFPGQSREVFPSPS